MMVSDSLRRAQRKHPHMRRWEIPKIESSLLVELPGYLVPNDYLSTGDTTPSEAKDTEIGSVWDGRGASEDTLEHFHKNDLVFRSDHNWYRLVLRMLAESQMHRVDSEGCCVESETKEQLLTRCEQCEGEKALRFYVGGSQEF